ncbi:hypothetical protein C8Q77DRAFT_1204680 [Trametes polyzona]|nr:hypothetical protein C8Q77DRAFT_1204680 [Trametes polyzona]
MQLTFSPALGEQTFLKVAPAASERPAAQSILFRATFDSRESLLKAQADGVKIELWSDVPAGGRSLGEWGASQFSTLAAQPESDGTPIFSLRDTEEEEDPQREHSLYVHLRLPHIDHVGARFSFTYRLVYPSGDVKWLGEYGRNGELVIERGLPGVNLREGWNIAEDGTYRTHAFPGERVLGHLEDPDDWVCWSWRPSDLPTFTRARKGSEGLAIVLSPRTYTRQVNVIRPLVFVASHSATLKITQEGRIVLHSSSPFARVSFSVLEHSRDLLEGVAALCDGEVCTFDDVSAVISCRSLEAKLPLHIIVLPMSDNLDGRTTVPLRPRDFPREVHEWDGLVLVSSDLSSVELFPTFAMDRLGLVGRSGCELIATPAHKASAGERTAHVALLTPYKDASVKVEQSVAHTLPTPPPSPPRSSTATPTSGESRQSRTPTPTPARPSMPTESQGRSREIARPRRPASSALIPYRSPHFIRRYLHMVINVAFWFWSVFVRALATRLVGESVTRRISGFLGLALMKTAPPATPKVVSPEKPTSETIQAEPRETTPEPSNSGDAVSESNGAHIPDVSAPSPQYATMETTPVAPEVQPLPRIVFSANVSPSGSTGPIVLVQATATINKFKATVDGKSIPTLDVSLLDGGIQRLTFGTLETGGNFELSFDI